MDFSFDTALVQSYSSKSQQIRIMSEHWVANNLFCPQCGNSHISKLTNNAPVADFQCDVCGEIFELKSKNGRLDTKIVDGAYDTMMNRISSNSNTDLLIMQYSKVLEVVNLLLVPKFFFTPSIIEKRKPLAETARRAGWTGCNILIKDVPSQGRIPIITNQVIRSKEAVIADYSRIKDLQINNLNQRSWLFDVLNCVNAIDKTVFCLRDVYQFSEVLQVNHPENHNVQAKIRQQLQILRDKGMIEFLGNGIYKMIIHP